MAIWPRFHARQQDRNCVFMKAENSWYVAEHRRYVAEHRWCDAEGQLRLWLEPMRNRTWPLGELTHGRCGQDGAPVHQLLGVVRGYRWVLSPVCEFVD